MDLWHISPWILPWILYSDPWKASFRAFNSMLSVLYSESSSLPGRIFPYWSPLFTVSCHTFPHLQHSGVASITWPKDLFTWPSSSNYRLPEAQSLLPLWCTVPTPQDRISTLSALCKCLLNWSEKFISLIYFSTDGRRSAAMVKSIGSEIRTLELALVLLICLWLTRMSHLPESHIPGLEHRHGNSDTQWELNKSENVLDL